MLGKSRYKLNTQMYGSGSLFLLVPEYESRGETVACALINTVLERKIMYRDIFRDSLTFCPKIETEYLTD